MSKAKLLIALSTCLATVLCFRCIAHGQQNGNQRESEIQEAGQERYYGDTSSKETNKSIAQQKAEHRAAQRMARLEAMRWYGFTPGRPTAAALPFTSMYSPAWTQPGGRPFAWYVGNRPNIIVPRYYYRYR